VAESDQPAYRPDPSFLDSDRIDIAFTLGTTQVRLRGEVDLSLRESLDAVAQMAIGFGSPVSVDLSDVTFIDSTGLGFLARLAAAGKAGGWVPAIVGAHGGPREAIDLIGLTPVLDLTASDG
jgi:anti-anti-sigma factor